MQAGRTPSATLRILFFGTYDARTHPRIQALMEGFAAAGDEVTECVVPLGLDTDMRVRILQHPYLLPVLAARLATAWVRLRWRARRLPAPDVVVVGYLGHFDVHLARRIWPAVPIALDHLISAADTAKDRGVASGAVVRLLRRLDRAALSAADLPFVDTAENLAIVPEDLRAGTAVVRVGAPGEWFRPPVVADRGPLRVVFFGLFTPLQGTPVIGASIGELAERADICFTMIGRGQQYDETRRAAAANPRVEWLDWVEGAELPDVVAAHDVCLGIFGTGPKAHRVVPNKVYQGAAAGCVVVTSDTAPQRELLDGVALFVPPGDSGALADTLRALARDRPDVEKRRRATYERASAEFRPPSVVAPLRDELLDRLAGGAGTAVAGTKA